MGSIKRETTMAKSAKKTASSKSIKKSAPSKSDKKAKSLPAPSTPTKPARPGTKSSVILELLRRDIGATVKELAAAAGWQEHSVRGFMSGTLKKKLGMDVRSRACDGARYYQIEAAGGAQ